MAGLMDACDDEMKESFDAYRDSLAKTLAHGLTASSERESNGVDQ